MRILKVRFGTEEDMNQFNQIMGTSLRQEAKKLILPANIIKYQKVFKRPTPPIVRDLDYWKGMPEFNQQELDPYLFIELQIDDDAIIPDIAKKLDVKITDTSKGFWFPPKGQMSYFDQVWVNDAPSHPKHPIYVISKGRPQCHTSVALTMMGVKHHVVIEPQDYDAYASKVGPENLVILPFSNLGQGSIPARNWVWEHSINSGASWHWILDDNIHYFLRLTDNRKRFCLDGSPFKVVEDFVDRYENIGQAGMHYEMFVPANSTFTPIYWNTRIYSCILNRNDQPHRWRGKFNEDTDLSLRILKDGYATALFTAFMAEKTTTMRMKGGNTDSIYNDGSNRLNFAKSLVEQHSDVVEVTYKFQRWHHKVDYSPFRHNDPKLKKDYQIQDYDFKLVDYSKKQYKDYRTNHYLKNQNAAILHEA